ncbi:ABC transporter permease [Croceimicrobium hydrocarbonivorans]|uniref:ABC transporter permease n=1 Tax=Croceimicrobium hydrocarbonivorans TaxID=2761580 RepID=A0A7H0VA93_9FLAO|nr:ABC transporter permease [Croceimicrobium hydrocarbonivorans]QNR22641.1 ABC transporter permease [Croceimicrobium hydrocarbonivorans]
MMFSNYLKVSWRHLLAGKANSIISVLGLSVGVASAILIALYIQDELSYDQFHTKKDRIARIVERIDHNGEIKAAVTSFPVGPQFMSDYPEVVSFVRIMQMGGSMTIKVEDQIFREDHFLRADSTLFEIFDFKLLQGDPIGALAGPNLVVLNEELAIKFFGTPSEAMGKQLFIGTSQFTVNGVVENGTRSSDIKYQAFTSMSTLPQQAQQVFNGDWFRLVCQTYLLFDQPVAEMDFDSQLADFTERIIKPFVATFGWGSTADFTLQPLEGLHFDNSREYDTPKGNLSYLYIFGLLALLILIIATINFVNLALSQSVKRAKEVGVRKALGAGQNQLRNQFLGESFLVVLLAMIIGLGLVEVLLATFNTTTDKNFAFVDLFDWRMLLTLLGILLVTALMAGLYPALVLSKFQSSRILRGSLPKIGRYGNLRRILMVVQLAFSILMIIGTLAIQSQMRYLQDMDLGFEQDQIVVLNIPQDTAVFNHLDSFKDRLLAHSEFEGVSGSQAIPGTNVGELMFRIEQNAEMVDKNIKFIAADEDFFEILGLELVNGRLFSNDIQSDVQQAFIINETAAKSFGWDEPLGKRIQWGLQDNGQAASDGEVVGVIKDFHFASLHNPMEPLVILFRPNFSLLFSMKLSGGQVRSGLTVLEEEWSNFAGNHPLEYTFLDERIQSQYESEKTLLKIFGYFAFISIMIAGLGLFALTSYTVEQRLKEFSVRKILGAELKDLGMLLAKEFMLLIGVAALISIPLAGWGITSWLEEFSYRISMPWLSFVLALLLIALVTLIAMSYHVIRLARTNPARILRDE